MTTDRITFEIGDKCEVIIADLIRRIGRTHEAYMSLGANPSMRTLDANWSRIYALLIELHESLILQHARRIDPVILSKIDVELVVIEAFLGCISSQATKSSLH